ncbi:MAG: excinuclease ABC subunit UvrC, partial [Alphaproteobacteria bacterium]|nr:excinuclease ABC subunit UvrC [Alphaproteobacteria bacterium]
MTVEALPSHATLLVKARCNNRLGWAPTIMHPNNGFFLKVLIALAMPAKSPTTTPDQPPMAPAADSPAPNSSAVSIPLANLAPTITPTLANGVEVIRRFADSLDQQPGVYRMLDAKGGVLYVGKARNLPKRVLSYTAIARLPQRLQRMVSLTASMTCTITRSETEALLLEASLIKTLRPRFNIVLRDDKTYPYILLAGDHPFPRLLKYRGKKDGKGVYIGPYASVQSVEQAILTTQKVFGLRTCADTVFAHRSRPCLQYFIKRCTAPCVGYISQDDYTAKVAEAQQFLSGDSGHLRQRLVAAMEQASLAQAYEQAAALRDQLKAISWLESQQSVHVPGLEHADVVACFGAGGWAAVQLFFIRNGRHVGNSCHLLRQPPDLPLPELLASFLAQFYEQWPAPPQILITPLPADASLLADALTLQAGHKVALLQPQRGAKADLLSQTLLNARQAHQRKQQEESVFAEQLQQLQKRFGLPHALQRVEVFDNSHLQGDQALGAMIVVGQEGFHKSAYRRFNHTGRVADTRDDYAMMRATLQRRLRNANLASKAPDTTPPDVMAEGGGNNLPQLWLIDGGKGQLHEATAVLAEQGLSADIAVIAI